jgi:lipid A 3-O-deacylase
VLAAAPLLAQGPISVSVRADNDAFDFWLPPWDRPDEEYTSGVRATLEYAGAAPWERWLHRNVTPCSVGAPRCATHTFALGQDIYTGQYASGDTSFVKPTRPNAGWLYLQESSRVESTNSLDETSLTLGVTGPPALAQVTQEAAHGLGPTFNHPTDWSTQLPFEPGIIIAYERTQRMLVFGEGQEFGGDVEPHAGASLGNILTGATAGIRVRAGFRLHHPWLLAASTSVPEISFFADGTMNGVVRDEFLAGTLFRPSGLTSSDRVDERPFVPEGQVGVTVRWRQLAVTYMVDRTASEYVPREIGHTWSRLAAEWRFER